MEKYEYIRFFGTEAEAREFAEKVNGEFGWLEDFDGNIVKWEVDYNEQ